MLPSVSRQARIDSLEIQEESSPSGATYRPLNTERKEIRLLTVQPGSGDEPVVGTLKCISLGQAVKLRYETVSYVWGDKTERGTIVLHGHQRDVPASSEMVLRRMRRPDCQRVLWIDAVCINQDDDKERGVQVAMMDMIYNKGSRNLVWLGEARGGDEEALTSIRALVRDMRIKTLNFRLEPFLATPIGVSTAGLLTKRSISIAEGPIVQFFSRSWFERLWVIQEAALARYSVCYLGDASIPLRHVLRAALWIRHLFHPTESGPHPLMMITNSIGRTSAAYEFFLLNPRNTSRFKLMPFPFINLLEITEGYATSEPRDHIFATLGLARQHFKFKETPQLLAPRYDVPVAQVFRDAARFCLQSASDLQVLELINRHQGTVILDGQPTWVPDFGEQESDEQRAMYSFVRRSFNADTSRVWRLKDAQNYEPNALGVEGFVVGDVSARSEQHGRDLHTFALLSDPLRSLAGTSLDANKAREDGTLGMVLTAGTTRSGQRWSDKDFKLAYQEFHNALVDLLPKVDRNTTVQVEQLASRRSRDFYLAVAECGRRRLFTTTSGHIGSGPETIQSGDVIAILYGLRMPIALRPLGMQRDTFEVVGVCYVHGIMDGEAERAYNKRGWKQRLFTLR